MLCDDKRICDPRRAWGLFGDFTVQDGAEGMKRPASEHGVDQRASVDPRGTNHGVVGSNPGGRANQPKACSDASLLRRWQRTTALWNFEQHRGLEDRGEPRQALRVDQQRCEAKGQPIERREIRGTLAGAIVGQHLVLVGHRWSGRGLNPAESVNSREDDQEMNGERNRARTIEALSHPPISARPHDGRDPRYALAAIRSPQVSCSEQRAKRLATKAAHGPCSLERRWAFGMATMHPTLVSATLSPRIGGAESWVTHRKVIANLSNGSPWETVRASECILPRHLCSAERPLPRLRHVRVYRCGCLELSTCLATEPRILG